ncbi:MAG: hypothetical protein PHY62_11430 [Gallionella sp.]|nr:hypothetical protein [Gallionella sp.]
MSESAQPFLVRRTCTRKSNKADEQGSHPLELYRDKPAYVLLGDPGAGKTESFRREADESGGVYVRARDFAIFELDASMQGKPLFIDGLDEMPAADGDRRHPLDRIRERLIEIGKPPFRLSCREADWLGESGRAALELVSKDIIALHLDPLNDGDIAEILRHKTGVADADEFMRKAREHRLDELLRNPQTLNLLVEAVGGNEWPQSRMEIYAMACNQLVGEKNPEHRQAKREKALPAEALLDAAGYLCAIQLLSGMAGFSLDEASADEQHRCWTELREHKLPLLAALKTNLFQGDGGELRIPVHRSVAEFLGARYLATRIEHHGLPFDRVIALMAGEDGGMVSDLRGLAAWLSVHSHSGRRALIERDPLGVVLYGDVRNFSVADKQLVLTALKNEAQRYPWFRSEDWSASPFGALGTKDMEQTFRDVLASSSRDEADQSLLDCVLDALRHGDRILALASPLEVIVRDSNYWPRARANALQALIHILAEDDSRLLKLAEDICVGIVKDDDDELLGDLLGHLYPRSIKPERIFDYLHPAKDKNLIGCYSMFWSYQLSDAVRDDLPLLLDKLVLVRPDVRKMLKDYQSNRMAGRLLARGLEEHGEALSDERLYDWLSVGLDAYNHQRLDREYAECISAWFSGRPERYKAVIERGATLCADNKNVPYCMSRCLMRLYGSTPPADIGMWYLEKAASEPHAELAEFYFTRSVHMLIQQGGQSELNLTALEFLESWVAVYPKFGPWLEPYISKRIGDWEQEHAINDRKSEDDSQKHKRELVSFYHKHIAAIRDGSVHSKMLHDLALAHDGLLYEARGDTPRERLANFLDGDNELIKAAYAGLRHALDRADLPSVDDIVELEIKGRMHYIRSACLVGMDELFNSDPVGALQLPDEVLSRLLAFRLSYDVGDEPPWFSALVQQRPELVATVLLAYAVPMLRAGKEHVSGLYALAHNDTYAKVACLALPELLEKFPLRASKLRLSNALDPLIRGALRYLDHGMLASIVARKLELGSMDAAQQVYWLGCGLLLAPDAYEARLFKYVGKSAVRRGYLAGFLYSRHGERRWPEWMPLPITTLAKLIELLAPDCSPERPKGVHSVTPAMNTADMVSSIINALGNNTDEVATHELERLLGQPKLMHWHNHLRGALHSQRITRRKATFRRLHVAEVDQTIANLQPANAADLTALTFHHLRDIARKIRDGGTDDYKQYWSYDESNKKLEKPKPENDCRDALLSDLQERLGKVNIDAQPEGNYADHKRADIRVSFGGGFNVPIEIKKDSHDDLWRAIHEQLIPKYVRDPGADGHGIYLVFWLGGQGMRPSPDGGNKPRSAQELEVRLRQTLSPEELLRIWICVIDCALP